MATRAMVFIDGTWLAVTTNRLAEQHGLQGRTGGPLDFGALPRVCAQAIASQMAITTGLDVVRTHYFGSIATNFDLVDQDAVLRRAEFFDSLRRHHRYEVYRFETDYRGHRVRRTPGEDAFAPPEKAVDVGLATALLEMAAVSAYDIAIVVCGDRDFVPALQAVRRLGKRVAIVSARGSCAREFSDPNDPARVRDFDPLWIDALWHQIVAPGARSMRGTGEGGAGTGLDGVGDFPLNGDAPAGDAPAGDATTDAPSGPAPVATDDVYPMAARGIPAGAVVAADSPYSEEREAVTQSGVVTKVHANGYGFVRGDDGSDYYFRRSDFVDMADFARLERFRTRLTFRVSEMARIGQAGRAASLVVSGQHDNASLLPPRSAPLPAPSHTLSDDLWALDPFAAPVRRDPPPPPVATVAPAARDADVATAPVEREVTLGAPVTADIPPAVAAAAADDLGVEITATPPAEAPRKKRVSRKTLPA